MSDNTDICGLPYPTLGDDPDIEEAVKPLAEAVDTLIVPRFATTTERDGAITAPVAGMQCYVATHGPMFYSRHSAWVPMPGTQVARLDQQAPQSIPDGTITALTFGAGSQSYLPYGGHSTTSNTSRFVAPFPGRYSIKGILGMSFTASGTRTFYIYKNGTVISGAITRVESSTLFPVISIETTVYLNGSTDYTEIRVHQDSGSAKDTLAANSFNSSLTAIYGGEDRAA